MEHPNGDISNADLFEAISGLSTHTDQQFARVDQQFARVDQQFARVDQQFADVRADLKRMDDKIERIDQRLAALQGELEDIRVQLERLERRTLEDSDAHAKDVLELRTRMDALESQFRALTMKFSHA